MIGWLMTRCAEIEGVASMAAKSASSPVVTSPFLCNPLSCLWMPTFAPGPPRGGMSGRSAGRRIFMTLTSVARLLDPAKASARGRRIDLYRKKFSESEIKTPPQVSLTVWRSNEHRRRDP